jgi:hypothetical protein
MAGEICLSLIGGFKILDIDSGNIFKAIMVLKPIKNTAIGFS